MHLECGRGLSLKVGVIQKTIPIFLNGLCDPETGKGSLLPCPDNCHLCVFFIKKGVPLFYNSSTFQLDSK